MSTLPSPTPWTTAPPRGVQWRLGALLTAVVGVLVGFTALAVYVLSGAQSYVRSEGFYVKSQLAAAHHIGHFAETGDPDALAQASAALERPLAYRQYRLTLLQPDADPEAARRVIEAVGYRPSEAARITRLFPLVRHVPPLRPAFEAWIDADALTLRLDALRADAEQAVATDGAGAGAARLAADEAAQIAVEVSRLGVVFSDTLEAGSDAIRRLLLGASLVLGLALVVAAGLPAYRLLRRLRQADGRYRRLVRHGSDIVSVVAADGQVLYESPSVERVLGHSPESLIGQDVMPFIHPDDHDVIAEQITSALEGVGDGAPFRYRVRHADGHWVTLEGVTVNLLADPSVRGLLVNSRDVSALVQAEADHAARVDAEAARQAAEETAAAEAAARVEAEEHLRLKESFLNNMSHELRTPLTAILGFSEMLADEAAPEDRDLALAILRGGLRLRTTLNSVLDHAQLASGQTRLAPTRMDVAHEAREAIRLLQPLADEKGLALVGPEAGTVPAVLDADAFGRIVVNLVDNAIKFTEAGAVTVGVRTVDEDMIEVRVSDTGIGIGTDDLDRVFRPFEQASEGLDRQHEGNGLGLAIARGLVDLMHGRIDVESVPGEGTTVRVTLPVSFAVLARPQATAVMQAALA